MAYFFLMPRISIRQFKRPLLLGFWLNLALTALAIALSLLIARENARHPMSEEADAAQAEA